MIEVESALLEGEVLGGQAFLAQHGSGALLVIRDPELGILVKQAGERRMIAATTAVLDGCLYGHVADRGTVGSRTFVCTTH